MKAVSSLRAVAIILAVTLALTGDPAMAQPPTPGPGTTPTVTPTPALWPQPVSDAIDWIGSRVQNYGLPITLVAVAVGLMVWLGRSAAGGVSEGIKELVKERVQKIPRKRTQTHRLDERFKQYLANAVSAAFYYLDLKALDERYDTEVRLREVYIPLRARGLVPEEERGRKDAQAMLMGERDGKAPELTEWLARAPNLVVLGKAGSGKSTFLKYTATILADAVRLNKPELVQQYLKVTLDPLPVPVYFPLRDFGVYWQALKPEDKTLARQAQALLGFLEHNFKHHGLDAAFFQGLLRQGRCLIFLDGLDEVKQEMRPAVVEVVEAFVRELASADPAHPNRYVVACRPEAYRGQAALSQFQEVTIEPLDETQVKDFVRRWYREALRRGGQLTPEAEREADEKTRTLLQAIETKPQVRDLTDTPLLLTLVAMLHHRAQLPESRVALYHDCTRLLLDKWERSRPGEHGRLAHLDLTPPEVPGELEDRRRFLQPAAYWLLQAGLAEAPRPAWAKKIAESLRLPGDPAEVQKRLEIFLEWSKDRCNILEEGPDGQYRFTHHRTFQEYLAAGYLVSLGEQGQEIALRLVPNRDWWETLRLMVASTPIERQSDLLCRILDRPEPEGTLLAASCLAELKAQAQDRYLDPSLTQETSQKLVGIMTNMDLPAKESRALAGQLLGRLDDPRLDVSACVPVVVPVPAGDYWLGSRDDNQQAYSHERPRCQVSLPAFWIGRYPVSNAPYTRFVDASGYENERFWTPDGWDWRRGKYKPDLSFLSDKKQRELWQQWIEGRKGEERERPYFWKDSRWNISNHPVVGVTWFEAMAYCAWLAEQLNAPGGAFQVWRDGRLETISLEGQAWTVRLPTEAEWEAAARGQVGSEWPWGDTFDAKLANTSESDIGQTTAIGQYPGGASPCHALDMAGNVWEWCHSLYQPYPYRADDGREDVKSSRVRVLRGGSWYYYHWIARCANRNRNDPANFNNNVGFRVVFSHNSFAPTGTACYRPPACRWVDGRRGHKEKLVQSIPGWPFTRSAK